VDITVPLRRFVEYLDRAREFDRIHPAIIDRLGWLLDSFSFDNATASYEPLYPTPWPRVDQAAWWWNICRK
jgi:hypothetical protein